MSPAIPDLYDLFSKSSTHSHLIISAPKSAHDLIHVYDHVVRSPYFEYTACTTDILIKISYMVTRLCFYLSAYIQECVFFRDIRVLMTRGTEENVNP